jgi:hypothetical protein
MIRFFLQSFWKDEYYHSCGVNDPSDNVSFVGLAVAAAPQSREFQGRLAFSTSALDTYW